MKYLQIYDELSDYNTSIGDNAYYDVFPNVSLISSDKKNPKFLKYPKHTVTYENFDNGLLCNSANVKRIWNDGKVVFENPNEVTLQRITVGPGDFQLTSSGFPINVQPAITMRPSLMDKFIISSENGFNDNDWLVIFVKGPFNPTYGSEWSGIGAPWSAFGNFELIDGQLVAMSPLFIDTPDDYPVFLCMLEQPNDIIKPITIEYKGASLTTSGDYENRGTNITTLPGNIYIDYLIATSLIELDDYRHGFFMRIEGYSEVIPVGLAKDYGFMTDNQTFYLPINGELGTDMEYGFCEVNYINETEWSQEVTSFIDCDITVYKEIPLINSIDTSKFTNTEVTFEVFNRFYPLYWKGSNIKNGDENWLRQVRVIPSNCFYGCTYLTEINIPKGVTEIQNDAFNGCTNLTKVTLPNTLTKLHGNPFDSCASLKDITCYAMVGGNVTFDGFSNIPKGGIIRVPEGSDMNHLATFVAKGWEIKFI